MSVTRRDFFKGLGLAAGAALVAGETWGEEAVWPFAPYKGTTVVVCEGVKYESLLTSAFAKFGGLKKFIRPGASVLVKPNIAWDRTPEQAANTNPFVVAALVKLCLAADAGDVQVYDHPCVNCRRSYDSSGIADAARDAGAKVSYVDTGLSKKIKFPAGVAAKSAEIYAKALEADVIVNVPIAKDHSLAGLTLGMKNLMGLLLEDRGRWHQNLDKKLVDLAQVITPQLTVIDATRIMTANGPTGGDLAYVKRLDKLIVATDVTAADAYATTLFGWEPTDLGVVKEAARRGFGTADLEAMKVLTVRS